MRLNYAPIGFFTAVRIALKQCWKVFKAAHGYKVIDGDTLTVTSEFIFGGVRRGFYEKR